MPALGRSTRRRWASSRRPRLLPDADRTLRHRHYRQRRRRRYDGARAVEFVGPHPRPRTWRPRPSGGRELGSGGRVEAPAVSRCRTLARSPWPRVSAVHALRCRRQYEVLGQRPVPAAARRLPGGRARGRRFTSVADRLRNPRAVLRAGRAAVPCARPAWRRPDRVSTQAVSVRTGAARARHLGDRRATPRPWLASVAAAARCAAAGRAWRLRALQHVQLLSVQDPREERRRGLRCSAGTGAADGQPVDQRLRAAFARRSVWREGRGG